MQPTIITNKRIVRAPKWQVGLTLRDCDLTRAHFSGAVLPSLTLHRCNLDGARFNNAVIPNLRVFECRWWSEPPSFTDAILWGSEFCDNVIVPEGTVRTAHEPRAPYASEAGAFHGADMTGAVVEYQPKHTAHGECMALAENFKQAFLLGLYVRKAGGEPVPSFNHHIDPAKPAMALGRITRLRQVLVALAHGAALTDPMRFEALNNRATVQGYGLAVQRGPAEIIGANVPPEIIFASVLACVRRALSDKRQSALEFLQPVLGMSLMKEVAAMQNVHFGGLRLFDNKGSVPLAAFMVTDAIITSAIKSLRRTASGEHDETIRRLMTARNHMSANREKDRMTEQMKDPPVIQHMTDGTNLASMWTAKYTKNYVEPPAPFTLPEDQKNAFFTRQTRHTTNAQLEALEKGNAVQKQFDMLRDAAKSNKLPCAEIRDVAFCIVGPINASDMRFVRCSFKDCDLSLWDMAGATFADCTFHGGSLHRIRYDDLTKGYGAGGVRATIANRISADEGPYVRRTWPNYEKDGKPVFTRCDFSSLGVGRVSEADFNALWKCINCTMPVLFKPRVGRAVSTRGRRTGKKWWSQSLSG